MHCLAGYPGNGTAKSVCVCYFFFCLDFPLEKLRKQAIFSPQFALRYMETIQQNSCFFPKKNLSSEVKICVR